MSPDLGRSGRSFAPPRWVYRTLWTLHRAGYRASGGRLGHRSGAGDRPGTLRLSAGAERDDLWHRLDGRLADDERHAQQAEREIPIVILEPSAGRPDA